MDNNPQEAISQQDQDAIDLFYQFERPLHRLRARTLAARMDWMDHRDEIRKRSEEENLRWTSIGGFLDGLVCIYMALVFGPIAALGKLKKEMSKCRTLEAYGRTVSFDRKGQVVDVVKKQHVPAGPDAVAEKRLKLGQLGQKIGEAQYFLQCIKEHREEQSVAPKTSYYFSAVLSATAAASELMNGIAIEWWLRINDADWAARDRLLKLLDNFADQGNVTGDMEGEAIECCEKYLTVLVRLEAEARQ